jgi:hypothetical protein
VRVRLKKTHVVYKVGEIGQIEQKEWAKMPAGSDAFAVLS